MNKLLRFFITALILLQLTTGNAQQLFSTTSIYNWDADSWTTSNTIEEYHYPSAKVTHHTAWELRESSPLYIDSVVYNTSGLELYKLTRIWDEAVEDYINSYSSVYAYDQDGKDTSFKSFSWNTDNHNWDLTSYNTTWYTESSLTKTIVKSTWDFEKQQLSEYERTEYIYDHAKHISSVSFSFFNDKTGVSEPVTRRVYPRGWHNDDQPVQAETYTWNGTQWVLNFTEDISDSAGFWVNTITYAAQGTPRDRHVYNDDNSSSSQYKELMGKWEPVSQYHQTPQQSLSREWSRDNNNNVIGIEGSDRAFDAHGNLTEELETFTSVAGEKDTLWLLAYDRSYNTAGLPTQTIERVYDENTHEMVNSQKTVVEYARSTGLANIIKPDHQCTLYPNPANSFVSIGHPKGADEITGINIYDLQGKLVLHTSQANTPVDISSILKGMYCVEIMMQSSVDIQKLLVK